MARKTKPKRNAGMIRPGQALAIGNPGRPSDAELEADTAAALHALRSGDDLISLRRWMREERKWSQQHSDTIMARARAALVVVTREAAEETRARLLAVAERGLSEVRSPVRDMFGQRVQEPGPDGKPMLVLKTDHKAGAAYLTLIADLTGLRKTVIETRDTSTRPAMEMSDEEILNEIRRLEDEVAGRAAPADVVAVEGVARPVKSKALR